MSLQAILNKSALDEVFKIDQDMKKWIDYQDSHHKNQILHQLIQNGCRKILAANSLNSVEALKEIEAFCRTQDAVFRHSSEYVSYPKFHAHECNAIYDGDENSGYCYTTAHYDDQNYVWEFDK